MVWVNPRRLFFKLLKLYGLGVICKMFLGCWRRRRMMRMLSDVPSINLPWNPINGNIKAFASRMHDLHDMRVEATRGMPVCKVDFGFFATDVSVLISKPEAVLHILKDSFNKYSKPLPQNDFFLRMLLEFIGYGIFSVPHGIIAADNGAAWKSQRKIAAGIFTKNNFNFGMHEVFVRKAKRLRTLLPDGRATDMQDQFFHYTLDSINQIFFGQESDTIAGSTNVYGDAFDGAHRSMMRFFFSTLTVKTLLDLLPWPLGGLNGLGMTVWKWRSEPYAEFRRHIRTLDVESAVLIEKVRQDKDIASRSDLIALYLQAAARESVPRSDKFLRDTILNFVIAGRDTTACLLTWMFYELATNPEIQHQVTAEIDEKLPNGTDPTLKLVHHSETPLLHALLYETLRLHPPVPVDGKTAACDDVWADGTHIPKGTKVNFQVYTMGRNPDVYEDPLRVKLERWVPFKAPSPHEFPVFQAGPRICLGMDMAIYEAKVLAAMLLQQFSFTLLEGEAEKIHYSNMLTMSLCNSKDQDSHNLWLIPHRRETAPAQVASDT